MFSKNAKSAENDRLDALGRALVRSPAMSEEELENLASSPFLSTRLLAQIEAKRASQEESGDWLGLLVAAWRAVPAMSLAAAIAVGALLFASNGDVTTTGLFTQESLLATAETTPEDVFFVDDELVSPDEVLSTLVNENDRSLQR